MTTTSTTTTTIANRRIRVDVYIDQFNIIGNDYYIQMLYSALLNKFRIEIGEDEYEQFNEFQNRIFDLIENLRNLSRATIPIVINYLSKKNPTLPDIIIMMWCLPRPNQYLSQRMYKSKYKENIKKYNYKMIENVNNETIMNFCVETLSKTNNVPVHCIDYLWLYMGTSFIEFNFLNSNGGHYISIMINDSNSNANANSNSNSEAEAEHESIKFGFDMEFLLGLGLGQIIYPNDPQHKMSFRQFLYKFVTDQEIVSKLIDKQSKNNFYRQLSIVSKNPQKYFGIENFPKEILELI